MNDHASETVTDEERIKAPVEPEATPGAPAPETEDTAPPPEAEPTQGEDTKPRQDGLIKRVGELTAKRREAETRAEAAERRAAAAEALLAARAAPDAESPPPAPTGSGNYEADVNARAAQIAAANDFNARCNAAADKGAELYGAKFQESVATLNELGLTANAAFLSAVIDTDAPADLLNYLGQNAEDALRISELPPTRQAVELDRVVRELKAPKPAPALSKAPAPISPVGGERARDTVDIYAEDTSEADYYAQREAAWKRKHG